ncbi:MAG: Fis family transcriptional regulator [Sulfuricurvum sp.]|nr:Fis family transcriptional regulator [Sulfuricurvum sp.]
MIADVVEVVVTTAVDVTNFLTASSASLEAFKTANLLKGLSVNAMIMGERGTGKLTLARYILPSAPVIDGHNFDELLSALETHREIIVHRLDGIANLKRLEETVSKTKTRIIATGGFRFTGEQLENIFSIRLLIPSLRERPEDIDLLTDTFVQEAQETFGKSELFNRNDFVPDVSENALSLRRQVYLQCLLHSVDENNLMDIMEQFLIQRLGSNNDYRAFLHLYEVPLIRAGIKRFKSQLQLSDKLGLNRNTLRKKIAEHAHYQLEMKDAE